jgi:hypothetical protein
MNILKFEQFQNLNSLKNVQFYILSILENYIIFQILKFNKLKKFKTRIFYRPEQF